MIQLLAIIGAIVLVALFVLGAAKASDHIKIEPKSKRRR